jgi:hypothetical protein
LGERTDATEKGGVMPSSTNVNLRTTVHKGSQGVSTAFPDVCKTPSAPPPFVPIPYPNIAMSSNTQQGSPTVKVDGHPLCIKSSCFNPSSGDEPGSGGGVASNTFKNKAEFIMYSFDVSSDGEPVPRQLDQMLHNKGGTYNTPPAVEIQPPNVVVVMPEKDEEPPELTSLDTKPKSKKVPR